MIAGNYRERKINPDDIGVSDWYNHWNLFTLFNQENSVVTSWCMRNGFLHGETPCDRPGCSGHLKPAKRTKQIDGATLRCTKNRDHEMSIRKKTIFERSKLTLQDAFMFTKTYLDWSSLLQCLKFSGVAYGSTALDWGSFVREVRKEFYHRNLKNRKLSGQVEIDESLFGRKIKYNRGNRSKGLRFWVFSLVERDSNTILLYPVTDRKETTLLPLIQRHVA